MIIVTLIMTAIFLNFRTKEAVYMTVAHGIPTLFLIITVYLSHKNLKMVEMLGLSIIIPTVIIVVISNMTDVIYVTQDSRNL